MVAGPSPSDSSTGLTQRAEVPKLIGPASLVGRYQLLRPVRSIGMVRWFDAYDHVDDEAISIAAVEVPESGRSPFQDIEAVAHVDHQAVIRPRQVAWSKKGWLLVTDRAQGRSLDEILASDGPLDDGRLIAVVADILSGLAACHRVGVVHGGLDASHVLLAEDGQVQILGLGLSTGGYRVQRSVEGDLHDVALLVESVSGRRRPPRQLRAMLDGLRSGDLDAAAARDLLLARPDGAGPNGSGSGADGRSAISGATSVELAPRPLWVKVLASLLVLTALAGMILVAASWLVGSDEPGPPTAVPNVVGEPLAQAQVLLDAAGFTVDVQLQADAEAPDGQVLAQDPVGGVEVPAGGRVTLIVASSSARDPSQPD